MGTSNLEHVTIITIKRFPDSDIIIVADHDLPGLKVAYYVANKYHLKIVMPDKSGHDFCDLRVSESSEGLVK